MNQRLVFLTGFPVLWILVWGTIAAVSIGLRPPLPGIELTSMAMAWDMWRQGDFLLPVWMADEGSAVYPLYLWLIHGTWFLFGVSDVWPRLLPPVLGLANTLLIAALCRALWPGWAGLGALGGTVAMGMVGWLILASIAGPELLFSFCILLAMLGLVMGWRRGTWDGFILLGFGVGLGFLSNGILVLIPVIPLALLAPIWAPALGWVGVTSEKQNGDSDNDAANGTSGWRQWCLRLGISLLIATVLILCWAVPTVMDHAADKGLASGLSLAVRLGLDSAFSLIVPAETGGRLWWLYPLALLLLLVPWIVWPAAWRSVGGLWPLVKDGAGRFCLIWAIAPLAVYALAPGARPYDVILHIPPLAIIAAYLLYLRIDPEMARQETERRFANGEAVLGILIALLGLLLIVVPLSGGMIAVPWWIEGLSGAWGIVLIGVAAVSAYAAPRMVIFRTSLVMVQMALVVVISMLAASPLLQAQMNIARPAAHIQKLAEQGLGAALAGKDDSLALGLGFTARLKGHVTRLDPDDSIGVVAWAAGNEGGQVGVVMETLLKDRQPAAVFPYKGQYLVLWPAEIIAEQPGIVLGKSINEGQ